MKQFAANYLYTNTGQFLKNGIAVVGKEGFACEFIDTQGELREIAQLTFLNGILMAGVTYIKTNAPNFNPGATAESLVLRAATQLNQFSVYDVIELGKQIQVQFPEMKIHEILDVITGLLLNGACFRKETTAGIYLLKEADLVNLHFLPNSRLKKIV